MIICSGMHKILIFEIENFSQVDEKDVLGEVGQGYKYAINILNEGRVGIGAQMIGIAQASLDATIPYLFDRKQFNQSLYSFQVSYKLTF